MTIKNENNRKVHYSTRLPKWIKRWLKGQDNQAKTITESLIKTNKLKEPK